MSDFSPKTSDRFAIGIWCVKNIGADPFGDAVREGMTGVQAVRGLAECGCWGFEFHDDDLIPFGSTAAQVKAIIKETKQAMKDTGIVCASGTCNLFYHPIFKDGAFTSHDPKVRTYAVQKVMRAIDVSAELGAENYIFWGGREGAELDIAKDPVEATRRFREAINFLCEYVRDNGYKLTFPLESKPNEPRGDIFLPNVGNALAFIETLDKANRAMVGVNPEVAHIKMAGLNPYHEYAQAIEAGKLFELHLNDQKPLRYDQDIAFGAVSLKEAFFIVKLLVENNFKGIKAFDCHPYRTETAEGVWTFVKRNMSLYKMLEAKVAQVNADSKMKELIAEITAGDKAFDGVFRKYSPSAAQAIKKAKLDPEALAVARRLPYEELDHRLNALLLGLA